MVRDYLDFYRAFYIFGDECWDKSLKLRGRVCWLSDKLIFYLLLKTKSSFISFSVFRKEHFTFPIKITNLEGIFLISRFRQLKVGAVQ